MLIVGFYLHYIYQYKYKNIPNSEKITWNPKYFWYKQIWIELILETTFLALKNRIHMTNMNTYD